MTGKKMNELSIIAELVRNRSLDRRKLMQTAAAMGLSAVGAGAALSQVRPAAAQEGDLNLVTVSQEQQATWIKNFNPLIPNDNSRWPT